MDFSAKEHLPKLIDWVREQTAACHGKTAVIGISGGKDSSVAAALCAEALGKDRVVGVLMPRGVQP
ncbi:MAG: NAD(+) synthase, partial [Oscillibacter sp.]|nr:NAD(+) synthase [Oscillibacter sp.]